MLVHVYLIGSYSFCVFMLTHIKHLCTYSTRAWYYMYCTYVYTHYIAVHVYVAWKPMTTSKSHIETDTYINSYISISYIFIRYMLLLVSHYLSFVVFLYVDDLNSIPTVVVVCLYVTLLHQGSPDHVYKWYKPYTYTSTIHVTHVKSLDTCLYHIPNICI